MKSVSEFDNIKIEDGNLTVDKFQTSDQDIVNYFEAIEPDKRLERLVNALKIGVVAIQTISRTDNVHYVEKVLGRLNNDLRNQMMELRQEFRIKETRNEIGWNVRHMPGDKGLKTWVSYYRKNFKMMREGKLKKPERPQPTEHVTTTKFDTARDKYKPEESKDPLLRRLLGLKKLTPKPQPS